MRSEAENWDRLETLLGQDWRLLIGGELVEADASRTFEVVSPYTEEVIASVPDASLDQVATAVEHAHTAFPAWRDLGVSERGRLVRQMADVVDQHSDDLALLDAIDGGAQVKVMARDVAMATEHCRFFANLALEMKGATIPASVTGLHFTLRQPYGVVARIIPFNHPILFAVKQIAAPLVAGNTVILKPSEVTPLSALHFARIVADVFPPGVLQILVGDGPQVPRAIVRSPVVSRIGFTGSESTGRSIQRDAADADVKTVTLELGGKNALVAFPDADPKLVARGAVRGMNFTWSGQSCGSTSRLVVHSSIADDVLKEIAALLSEHVVGSPLDTANDQGPMVSKGQYDKALAYIAGAVEEGATVVAGGGRPDGLAKGYFISPTVLDNVEPTFRVANEEIFGPVLSVIRWNDDDDPVAVANGVRYGLTASVYTNDLNRAVTVARTLDAGFVWINETSSHYLGVPFGGLKASGIGQEEALEELLSYTQVKAINIAIGSDA